MHEEQPRPEFNVFNRTIMKKPALTEHPGKEEDSHGHINTFSLQTLTETHLHHRHLLHHCGDGLVSRELCTVTGGFLLVLILFFCFSVCESGPTERNKPARRSGLKNICLYITFFLFLRSLGEIS